MDNSLFVYKAQLELYNNVHSTLRNTYLLSPPFVVWLGMHIFNKLIHKV